MSDVTRTQSSQSAHYDVLIIGGGAAGITVAAELLKHRSTLSVAIVEPSETHAYQPGWTLVGAGVFSKEQTIRDEIGLIPKRATWIKTAAQTFEPETNSVMLGDGSSATYRYLIMCPGLKLDWDGIAGLKETLGRNGVSSNYSASGAEYTWRCLQNFKGGNALFSQPAMPIKCAGAPQKIMYLAGDYWRKNGQLPRSNLEFCLAGDVLFGVPFFVPPLQDAVDDYGIKLNFKTNLKAIDGAAKLAFFSVTTADGAISEVAKPFDFLHVVPPQTALDFVRDSPWSNAAG